MAGVYDQIAQAIIETQAKMTGAVAYSLANNVNGLTATAGSPPVLAGDGAQLVEKLVEQYTSVTGPLGVRMCYMAAKPVLDANPSVSIPVFDRFK